VVVDEDSGQSLCLHSYSPWRCIIWKIVRHGATDLLIVVSSPGCRAAKRGSKNAQKRDGREGGGSDGTVGSLIADERVRNII